MKKTVSLVLIILGILVSSVLPLNAQSPKHPSLDTALMHRWGTLRSLIANENPAGAIKLLDSLTVIARQHNQRDYLLKSALFRLALNRQYNDRSLSEGLPFIDSLIGSSKLPVETSILLVIKARLLLQIYLENNNSINGRTAIQGSTADDSTIDSWTRTDYHQRIHALYTKALEPAEILQKTPNTDFEALVAHGKPRGLRPTMYDLLVTDAMDLCSSGHLTTLPSENPFKLDDPRLFADAKSFVKTHFALPDPGDSLNPHWLIVGYYQKLLAFRLEQVDQKMGKEALGDLDLQRLEWVHDNVDGSLPDKAKDAMFSSALENAIKAYKGTDAALFGGYLLANSYVGSATKYNALQGTDTAHRYDKLKALGIINRFDKELKKAVATAASTKNKQLVSNGAAKLLNLKDQILRANFNLQLEDYMVPGEPMRALVNFENVTQLYFRVLRMPVSLGSLVYTDSLWKSLVERTPVKAFIQKLPATGDHQNHAVEISIPALEKGAYILLTSTDPDFKMNSSLSAINFSVTNIAFIMHGQDQFFLDRKTGRPLGGVRIEVYNRQWKKDAYVYTLDTSLTANGEGRATYEDYHGDDPMMAIYKGDTLVSNLAIYQTYNNNFDDEEDAGQSAMDKGEKELIFYLDRSIYRPGQQVYFKGIATINYKDSRGRKLWTDDLVHKVYLLDQNEQRLDSLNLKLNDFGSFSGQFTLPAGHLPGNFSVAVEDLRGTQYFKVEQYKRPTYFVSLDTVKEAVAIGDSITIHGKAMAYSGYPITEATVIVNVHQQVYFPYRWFSYLPNARQQAIAHGTVMTDDKGNFSFTFKAVGGETSWLRYMPNYQYAISANCTDQNGETRSADSRVVVGSQPFSLQIGIPDNRPSDLLDSINLFSQTAAGQFTAQKVTLRITLLKAPERLLRTRSWPAPDMAVMDPAKFALLFPHDPYMQEDDKNQWPREKVIYERQLTTTKDAAVALDTEFAPGWYELSVAAPGNNGLTIKDKRYVYLYSTKKPILSPTYNWSAQGKTSLLPGEQTALSVASSVKDQYLLYSTTRMATGQPKGIDLKYGHLVLDGQPVNLPLVLTQKDRYGAQVDYAFIRDNRVYRGSMTVALKDTTVQPEIVYESYRDKTEPGSKENWRLHINKGTERLKHMELLSAMYDASLDQFTPHTWTLPGMNGGGQLMASDWTDGGLFGSGYARVRNSSPIYYFSNKSYDRLVIKTWLVPKSRFQFMSAAVMIRGRASGINAAMAPAAQDNALNEVVVGFGKAEKKEITGAILQGGAGEAAAQPVRSDFRETAFFLPNIHSDDQGNYSMEFQMPDALTTWKWMNLAYDKDLNMVTGVKEIVSQKTLMVSPNLPRFVRNGDQWTLSTKVINLSEADINSKVSIELLDPATGKTLNWIANNNDNNNGQAVTIKANSNTAVRFDIAVPQEFTGPVEITVKAEGGKYSDAEKNILPVITNKILVTETEPVYMPKDGKQTFSLDKLLAMGGQGSSAQKENKKLVFELTTNPIWHVVMALPDVHISDNPDGMAVIYKLYAEAMGNYVMNKYPAIAAVFKTWSQDTTAAENRGALQSALEKNPDLKTVLLAETPWVMAAKGEREQHKALLRFFDKARMDATQRTLVSKLLGLQQSDGGFSWFSGGKSNVLSTQWVLSGINQLTSGKLKDQSLLVPLADIAARATNYLNAYYNMLYVQWQQRIKEEKIKLKDNPAALNKLDTSYPISSMEIHYLYTLSMNEDAKGINEVQRFFMAQEKNDWQQRSVYLQLMMAATQYRLGDKAFAVNSLLERALDRAIRSEDLGMYWKRTASYYNWSDNTLEAQALAISLLTEVGGSSYGFTQHPKWQGYLAELQRYLIGQKQVNSWPATRTTVDACVAMIDAAPAALIADRKVDVQLGKQQLDLKQQVGTGYMRYEVAGKDITPDMGKVTIQLKGAGNPNPVPVYGALYWQYLSPIMAVQAADKTPGITLEKALYREVNTTSGKQLAPVNAKDILQVGDKLVSRLIIHVDRDMDYLHLREMRAAGVQPDQNISSYKYQDGLSYYQAIGDLTTDLYFDHINKGAYVIEYPVHVSHAGSFAAGTATMESFYAPEFTTHTEGIRIQAKQAD